MVFYFLDFFPRIDLLYLDFFSILQQVLVELYIMLFGMDRYVLSFLFWLFITMKSIYYLIMLMNLRLINLKSSIVALTPSIILDIMSILWFQAYKHWLQVHAYLLAILVHAWNMFKAYAIFPVLDVFGSQMIINDLPLLQDVAVKVFSKQEYSDEVILSFRQEVLLQVKLNITIENVAI